MDSDKERMSYEPKRTGPDGENAGGPGDAAAPMTRTRSSLEPFPPRDRGDFEIAIICACSGGQRRRGIVLTSDGMTRYMAGPSELKRLLQPA